MRNYRADVLFVFLTPMQSVPLYTLLSMVLFVSFSYPLIYLIMILNRISMMLMNGLDHCDLIKRVGDLLDMFFGILSRSVLGIQNTNSNFQQYSPRSNPDY